MEEEQEPAESSSNNESDWYSWGNSLLQGAKSKTWSTLELVKKDLNEFTDAVANQATATVGVIKDKTPAEAAATAGGWVKSLVGTVNSVFYVTDTTEGETNAEVPIVVGSKDSDPKTSPKAGLFALQSDIGTYSNEPAGAPELFEDWLDHFNLDAKKPEIRDLLSSNSQMRKIYAELVPLKMRNSLFWQRYFYKVHQFELDQARRKALLKRSDRNENADKNSWGDSDVEDFLNENLGTQQQDVYNVSSLTVDDLDEHTLIVCDKETKFFAPENPNAAVAVATDAVAAAAASSKRNSGSSDSWASDTLIEKIPASTNLSATGAKSSDEINDVCSENSFCLVSPQPEEHVKETTEESDNTDN